MVIYEILSMRTSFFTDAVPYHSGRKDIAQQHHRVVDDDVEEDEEILRKRENNEHIDRVS